MSPVLLTIKEVSKKYRLSTWMIYEHIKLTPDFPVVNIGPKKNYRIDVSEFKEWLERRTFNNGRGQYYIPTPADLIREDRKRRGVIP